MNSKRNTIILLTILLFFIVTRLYKIAEIPLSVYWDEASIGYNAYSIIKTGQDEWGKLFPLDFEAFGEYKLPVYIYTTALSVKLFGLNELAVRLPAVIFSLGTVIFSYLLARKIINNNTAGLLTAFFVTTSQWFFIISRTGFEATAGLMFFTAGVYLFIKALENKPIFLLLSVIFLILTVYSYNSFVIITPLTLFVLIAAYFNQLKLCLQKNLIFSVLCLVLLLIGVVGVVSPIAAGRTSRLDEVGISGGAYNHRKYQTLITATGNYLSHFSPYFLFLEGDGNGRSQQPKFGQINLIYLPLLILGIYVCIRQRRKEYKLILLLLLVTPIPASITKESPHALRSISTVPFLAIISSLGVVKLFSFLSNNLYHKAIIGLILITFLSYYHTFISSYTEQTANDWQYGYKVFYDKYRSKFNQFDHILISDRFDQPYIFALFYLKYDPDKFRSEVKYNTSIRRKTSLVRSFDKFIFKDIDYYQIPAGKNLIFTHWTDKMDEIKWKEVILNPNGTVGGYVYEYQK